MDRYEDVARTAARLRSRLTRAMVHTGSLTDPLWQHAFLQVPRHVFLPRFLTPEQDGWIAVERGDTGWLTEIYTDRVLVTQLDSDPTSWQRARDHGPVSGAATCSSSMPGIMAVMLEALEVADGMRVLEIGTGTGYNAALLCHRLGDNLVSTVDVDASLADAADRGLAECGYEPTATVGDGVAGYPPNAPYDRVLCTCAVPSIPLAWLEQTRPGGLVVTTLSRPLGAGLVRITAQDGPRGTGRVLAEDGRFMPLREHRTPTMWHAAEPEGGTRRTALPAEVAVSPTSPFEFFAGLGLPAVNPTSAANGTVTLTHPDGSWARHRLSGGRYLVSQGGPGRIWDKVEAAYESWIALGRPRRSRFGITVTPAAQELWLDEPDSPHRWPLT